MIKNILYLAIFTTVVVGSWIGFTIYHNITTSTIPQATSIKIEPITPTFDLETLQSLESRSKVAVDLSSESPFTNPIVERDNTASRSAASPPEELEVESEFSDTVIQTESVTLDEITPPADSPSTEESPSSQTVQ